MRQSAHNSELSRKGRYGLDVALAITLLTGFIAGPVPGLIGQAEAAVNSSSGANAAQFNDIDRHWAKDTILWAAQEGIVGGYPDGSFQPDKPVSEPEFLTMLFNAFPENVLPSVSGASPWYEPYYRLAEQYQWPVARDVQGNSFNRGQVARLLAASQGNVLGVNEAVQFLLDRKLANGKTANTIAGFGANDKLTRAEALKLIKNVLDQGLKLNKVAAEPAKSNRAFHVRNVGIGDSEQDVLKRLGQPARKDASEYGFTWYIYNQDYSNYAQIGIQNGQVAALFSTSDNWSSNKGVEPGGSSGQLVSQLGEPLKGLKKGNVLHLFNETEHELVFLIDQTYTTVFLDQHNGNRVLAVYIVDQKVEDAAEGIFGKPSPSLQTSYERQAFDISNAARANVGLPPFEWDELIAETARKHSKDMAGNGFFDHANLRGKSPFDRMKDDGIEFSLASENLAAGQRNAIFAYAGWMNSSGHRKNILGEAKRLGVGVEFGGKFDVYYTQNFYTPMGK